MNLYIECRRIIFDDGCHTLQDFCFSAFNINFDDINPYCLASEKIIQAIMSGILCIASFSGASSCPGLLSSPGCADLSATTA